MRSIVLALFAAVAVLAPPYSAQAADSLTSLGTLELQPNMQQDAFDIVSGAVRFRVLRVVAKSGSVVIKRIALVQVDGKSWEEVRDITLREGERTRQISLGQARKNVLRISFDYQIAAGDGPVTLEIFAKVQGPRPPPPVAEDKSSPGGLFQYRRHYYRRAPGRERPSEPGSATGRGQPERLEDGTSATATCVQQATCTPITVFFGTNRAKVVDEQGTGFSQRRADDLSLGRVVVTVPRAYRKTGEIPRPSWTDIFGLRNPWSEDPSRHFVLMKPSTHLFTTAEDYIADVRQKMQEAGDSGEHVFIFVHGFNTSFEYAAFRAAQISFDLGTGDRGFGTAMLFSWPSAGETEDYVYDLDSSRLAVAHLKTYIGLVTEKLAPKHVHLIAHSMGNWPLLSALNEIARDAPAGSAKIDNVILAAPDVDAKEFQTFVGNAIKTSHSFTLYASSTDRALIASKKLRRDMPRAGDVTGGGPVLVNGLDSLDVSDISTAIFSLNHSEYADKKELLNDMSALMQKGTRPPDARNPSFRSQGVLPTVFWRFVR